MASNKKEKDNNRVDIEKITREAAKSFSKESFKILKEIEKKNEAQRKLLENRSKAKTKEAVDQIDDIIDENTRKIRELVDEYNSGVASFWEEWTDQERDAFSERSGLVDDAVKDTERAIDKIRGRLRSSIEDVSDDMEESLEDLGDSFKDKMRDIADHLREWSNALNLTSLVQNTQDSIDSYMENIRQMRVATGSWFDEKGFSRATTDLVEKTMSFSRSESSEFISDFMSEFGLKQMEQVGNYSTELASATKAFGNSIADYENLLWKDSNNNYQGKLVRQVNNMAAMLEDDQYLNVKADGVVSKINENIDAIIGLHAGDEKRQKGLIKSVAAIEAIQQSAAVEGMGTLSEKMTEWGRMSIPELQEDENFLQYQALTGINAKTFYDKMSSGSEQDLKDLYLALYDSLNAIGGSNEYARQYNLHQFTQALGFSDYADLNSLLTMNRDDIVDYIHKSTKDTDKALDYNGSLATEKENESVTALENIRNDLTNSPLARKMTDFFSSTGLDEFVNLSNLANLSLIASGGHEAVKNIFAGAAGFKAGTGLFGKGKGFLKGFFGFGDDAARAVEAEAVGKRGFLSKLKNFFKRGSSNVDDVAESANKSGFLSKLKNFFKRGATSVDEVAEGTTKTGFFSKLKNFFKVGTSNVDDIAREAGKSSGFFSKLKNFFKIGSRNVDDVAEVASKGKLLTKLKGLFNFSKLSESGGLLSKVGKFFKNTKMASLMKGGKISKIAGKASGPLTAIFALLDGISGVKNTKKWTGNNKLSSKVSSFFAGVLSGTGPGLGEKGTKGEKFWNLFGGAGKGAVAGAAVGSVVPVLGTLAGGIIGGIGGLIMSAIGGKRVANFFDSVGSKISKEASIAGASIHQNWTDFSDSIVDWKNSMSKKWNSFGESVSSWRTNLSESFKSLSDWFSNTKLGKLFNKDKDNNTKSSVKQDNQGLLSRWFGAKGYEKGLSSVPFDNYPALLHKGESVLTKVQTDNLRNADGGVDTSKFSKLSIPELLKDEDFLDYQRRTGISAKEFYDRRNSDVKSLAFKDYQDISKYISNASEDASSNGKKDLLKETTGEDLLSVVKDIKSKLVNRFFKEDKDLSKMIRDFNENGLLGNTFKGGASGVLQKLTKGIFGSSGLGKDISNLISGKGTGGSLMTRLKKILGGGSNQRTLQASTTTGSTGLEGSGGSSGSTGSSAEGGSKLGTLAFHPNIKGKGAERWRPYVIDALKANKLDTSKSMQDKVIKQIKSESGGDPKAVNNWDSNAKNGTPSKGLLQTIEPTFNAHKFKGHDNIFNGYDNMLAALHYAKKRYGKTLMNENGNGIGSGKGYAVGTPFVPNDQVALIHEGEMIVPADQNPMNNPTTTMNIDKPQSSRSDNSQVIETMKWQVSRLESKLDRLISAVESKGTKRRMPREASDELNEAFSSVKRPGMGVL